MTINTKLSTQEEEIKTGENSVEKKSKPSTNTKEKDKTEAAKVEEDKKEAEAQKKLDASESTLLKGWLKNPNLSEKNLEDILNALPAISQALIPELSEYLGKNIENIQKMTVEIAALSSKKDFTVAYLYLVKFMESQSAQIDKISNPALRDLLGGILGHALEIAKAGDIINHAQRNELISEGINLIPVVGSIKMIYEGIKGQTTTNRPLQGMTRIVHLAMGGTALVLDGIMVASILVTLGASTVVSETGKAGLRATSIAGRGFTLAKTLSRFAAWTRLTTKCGPAAKGIFKVSQIIRANPKIFGALLSVAQTAVDSRKANLITKIKEIKTKETESTKQLPAKKE